MTRLPTNSGQGRYSTRPLAVLVLGLGIWACWPSPTVQAETNLDSSATEVTELELKSEFSRIIVSKRGSVRSLIFVHDDGLEALESQVDLSRPHYLVLPYTRYMFASYLFRPKPQRALIVGLGGGSMIHFLKHHDPNLQVDVVEIDPDIVKIADVYFGVRSDGKVKIILQDAFKYLKSTEQLYDAIYMDAFLKPSAQTDISGVPVRLKTVQFLKDMQKKLKPGGVVAFNVHLYDDTKETLATIRKAFPQVYVFDVSHRESLVVVGSTATQREKPSDLQFRAKQLDGRFRADFSFQDILKDLRQ
jgi:spermidine synthase